VIDKFVLIALKGSPFNAGLITSQLSRRPFS